MRFPEFLRAATLLFAGSASALGFVTVVWAGRRGDLAVAIFAAAWWTLAAGIGVWLGRRPQASEGIARLMASARRSSALPELEPGTILFNRLWGLAVYTVVAAGVGFLLPQIPAVAAGYALLVALMWRRQSGAVAAVEGRDGVRFYVDRTSPFKPTKLLRTPGFRRFEAVGEEGRAPARVTEARRAAGRGPVAQPRAAGVRSRRPSSSAHGRALATCAGATHARRAVATP